MATSSERSPPPFPDSEEQEPLEADVGAHGEEEEEEGEEDEGEDFFTGASNTPMSSMDPSLPTTNEPEDTMDDQLHELVSQSENKPASDVSAESPDDFVDLTNNGADSQSHAIIAETTITEEVKDTSETPSDEHSDEFVDLSGDENEAPGEEVPVEAAAEQGEFPSGITHPPACDVTGSNAQQEVKEESSSPVVEVSSNLSADTKNQPLFHDPIVDPLVDLIDESPPTEVKKPSQPPADLFEDEPSDLFSESRQTKLAKQPQTSLFDDPDEDLFGEPLVTSKKATSAEAEQKNKPVTAKAGGGSVVAAVGGVGGPLIDSHGGEPTDIFTEEAVTTVTSVVNSSVTSKANGVHSEEAADLFSEATVELSLDSPHNDRRKNMMTKPVASSSTLSKPQSASLEELEEEEQEDKFDINISITNPEKIGDGMNAYMAYRVSTQTTLPMFRTKAFTVRRRFSDFLGLYEKLSEKHSANGFIIPPPPEKSILGMTKVKVGKEDPSSAEFVERRRAALERYLQRVVCHPSLLQDPDVREFLERDELPRAVNTQAFSGAGFLKMINKATDAVSKMTIKMNESDVWFEEKLQEVESADQMFRKLHALVESLVGHRKELSLNTASFAKSTAMLGSAEDNTALSRALSQLAEVEDKMEQLHQEQASNDSFTLAELLADYIRLLSAVRGAFDQRMRAWQRWQDGQAMLQKKRESEAKLLWANKPDKLQLVKEEISEWEAKVTQYERDFDRVSATVRKEVLRFEKEKARDFQKQIIKYLEALLRSQQQLMKYWEAFLPEAKAIA
ncbi:sorting nexin-1a [Lampris incognitus]|uniref:sorting nexin-1a n=1 Tax=Lampris incognitus TaxID=2546036 RepID=UPI0024B54E10|nr:sorting nexin-1a [Lampris incognitus]